MEDKTWVNKALSRRSKISSLNPFLDKDGIIHVGGRLVDSCINNNCKHPILLPKNGKVTTLIIQHHHKMAAWWPWYNIKPSKEFRILDGCCKFGSEVPHIQMY